MSEPEVQVEPVEYTPLSQPEVDPWSLPLDDIDMSNGRIFQHGAQHEYFKRLREEDPVHYCDRNPWVGPFWSITRYEDVMAVDGNHKAFSSEPSIALVDELMPGAVIPTFIAMDPPIHDAQRKVVTPAVSSGGGAFHCTPWSAKMRSTVPSLTISASRSPVA